MKQSKVRKGITLIELLIVVPMISIILIVIYNMLFLTNLSFKYVEQTFNINEDVRSFVSSIQKEANEGKKANENTVLYKEDEMNSGELSIYTDVDDDGVPELVRYRLIENKIIKDMKKATNSKYPFEYKNDFYNEKIILTNVINKDIFGDIERVEEHDKYQDENDHRRKVKMIIKISKGENNSPIIIDTFLVTKSRTSFEN
ncbi:prepilin-type N-terminal cleavage/methylation domain-containing protein [Tissierella praeacuta]|uniref:PilW family protein n=1 Tax=Tissierella praeacuta TaxID=43131 RepID=UPI00333ED8E9